MTALRIGYDVTPLGGRRTGVGNYTDAVLRGMLAQAEGVEFRCLSTGRAAVQLESCAAITQHRHISLPTRAMYKLWEWTGQPKADTLLGGVEVFHATNYFLPPVAKARTVLTIYDLAFLKHPEWCSPKIVGPFSRGVHRFARQADAVIACSEATKEDIVALLGVAPECVHVVYGAVTEKPPAVLRPPHFGGGGTEGGKGSFPKPYLLFVSTLEPRKNIEGLLRAFSTAARDIPHSLVLAGGLGWGMEGLPTLIKSLGIQSRVHCPGYVSDADLPGLYAEADAFVFPSHYEGFGLPVLEAMSRGCPVITSKTSSLPEVGGAAARYVHPGDTGEIAEALREVGNDAALRDAMRAAGLRQAAKFSWNLSARQTLGIYRSLEAG